MADKRLDVWDLEEWRAFTRSWPDDLKLYFGRRLREVQQGGRPKTGVKPLTDFKIPLSEIRHRDGARVVFTTEYGTLTGCVHVLDGFMKDSADGSEMRKSDKKRIERRVASLKERMKPLEDAARQKRKGLH